MSFIMYQIQKLYWSKLWNSWYCKKCVTNTDKNIYQRILKRRVVTSQNLKELPQYCCTSWKWIILEPDLTTNVLRSFPHTAIKMMQVSISLLIQVSISLLLSPTFASPRFLLLEQESEVMVVSHILKAYLFVLRFLQAYGTEV